MKELFARACLAVVVLGVIVYLGGCASAVKEDLQNEGAGYQEPSGDHEHGGAPGETHEELEEGKFIAKKPLTGPGGYFIGRCLDFADLLGLSVMYGVGLDVNARASKIAQVGAGWYDAHRRLGFIGRYPGYWSEERAEGGISLLYGHWLERRDLNGPITKYHPVGFFPRGQNWDIQNGKDRTIDEVGGTAFAGFLGVDVHHRPVELIDFILGWFTVDIMDDDYTTELRVRQGE
ncbi:MAG: hypothetical protein HY720_13295 [Planctomycetes bacterium]|nr:hypothetical protein [Planctomycetota bacterium]